MINIEIGQEVEVSVTEEDIRHGRPCNSLECPISLAIVRTLKLKSGRTITSYANASALDKDISVGGFRIPSECRMFMNKFDHDKPVEPFSFKMTRIS